MNIILSMMISGNCLFVLYWMVKTVFKNFFSFRAEDILLKICILLFVVPWPIAIESVKAILLYFIEIHEMGFTIEKETPLVVISSDGFIQGNRNFNNIFLFFFIWLGITILLVAYEVRKYRSFRKWLNDSMYPCSDKNLQIFLDEKRKKLNIKASVSLFWSSKSDMAYTTGIWSPVIVLPEGYSDEALRLILLHELVHIKKGDVFFQFLSLICQKLYWFNIFVYFMKMAADKSMEFSCDEIISEEMDYPMKVQYVKLLISISYRQEKNDYASTFSKQGLFMKERMGRIMKREKISRWRRNASVAAVCIMTALSSIPAWAGQRIQILYTDENNKMDYLSGNESFSFVVGKDGMEVNENLQYQYQFVTETGEVYEVQLQEQVNPACNHVFQSGTFSKHLLESDGGCTIEYYEGKRCSKCGYFVRGDFIKEVSYAKCPH